MGNHFPIFRMTFSGTTTISFYPPNPHPLFRLYRLATS